MTIDLSQNLSLGLHVFFQWLGVTIGYRLYKQSIKNKINDQINEHSFMLFIMALSGAGVGLKLGSFIEDPTPYLNVQLTLQSMIGVLSSGGTIVGAIIGAYIFIEYYKYEHRIKISTGDYLVYGLISGIAIGRIGCFLAGKYDATYGNETYLKIGVYFGDELIRRHPTQLYEIAFLFILAICLKKFNLHLLKIDGLTFKFFVANYFLWRFAIDAIKPITYSYNIMSYNFSGIQLISFVASIYFYTLIVLAYKSKDRL